MGQCKSCNESINAPVYEDGEEWFCSLDCWNVWRRVQESTENDARHINT